MRSLILKRISKIPTRTIARTPAIDAAYNLYRKQRRNQYGNDEPCPLCETDNRVIIQEFDTVHVIENDYPYDIYDNLPVQRHLMLIPKRHLHSYSEFNDAERHDYWEALRQYSDDGFNSMTRSVGNRHRSVPGHLHTHLMRYDDNL